MKKIVLILTLIFLGFNINGTYLNYPSDMLYVPTTNTIGNMKVVVLFSQLMATTPYGYKFNTDWFEEDITVGLGFHIPWNDLKFELIWTQFTLVQGLGQYGAANIKVNFFEDPLIRFSAKKLKENPKLKYLPSMAFGLRNITGKGISYISPTGNDSQYLSSYSFYLVFSKLLMHKEFDDLNITFGLGGREFVGFGKMKNNGFFLGTEYTKIFKSTAKAKVFFEYSAKGIGIGGEFSENMLYVRLGLSNLQTIINSFKEERGVEINVGVGTISSLTPFVNKIPLFKKKYYAKPQWTMINNYKIYDAKFSFHIPLKEPKYKIVFPGNYIPPTKTVTTEELVKIVKLENGIQLKTKNIRFMVNSATLLSSSYKILDKIVSILKTYNNYSLIIEGHTDSSGNFADNFLLSKNRSQSVRSYLLQHLGMSYKNNLFNFGFGPQFPIASNRTRLGRQINRRVDFYIVRNNELQKELRKRQNVLAALEPQLQKAQPQPKAVPTPVKAKAVSKKEAPKKKEIVKSKEKVINPQPAKKPAPPKKIVKTENVEDLLKNGNFVKAIPILENNLKNEKSFSKKIKIKKRLGNAYFEQAKQLLKNKKMESGISYLKKTSLYKNSKSYEEAYFLLGQISYNKGEYNTAITYFQGVMSNYQYMDAAIYDNDDEALFKIVGCLIKSGKGKLAKQLLEKFSKQYPKSPLKPKVKLILEKIQ